MKSTCVIMSVYKNDKLGQLTDAVDSILGQKGVKVHLFIYKDGSLPIELDDYLKDINRLDIVGVYGSEINKGLAFALNYLIDLVVNKYDFEYIARMDSDDISMNSRLLKQVSFLDDNPEIDIVGTGCEEFGAEFARLKLLPSSSNELLNYSITRCPFIHPSVVFRKSVFVDSRYPENTHYSEDMGLWFDLAHKGYKFSNIPEALIKFRVSEQLLSRRSGFKKGLSEFKLRFKYMILLKKISFYNLTLVCARLLFHCLPHKFLNYLYKNAR